MFWKIRRVLFSCYLCFESRPFALLPTNLGSCQISTMEFSEKMVIG